MPQPSEATDDLPEATTEEITVVRGFGEMLYDGLKVVRSPSLAANIAIYLLCKLLVEHSDTPEKLEKGLRHATRSLELQVAERQREKADGKQN